MKLMEQVRRMLRVKHYALATERGYCHWMGNGKWAMAQCLTQEDVVRSIVH